MTEGRLIEHIQYLDLLNEGKSFFTYYPYLSNLEIDEVIYIKDYLSKNIVHILPQPPQRWVNMVKCCEEVIKKKRDDKLNKLGIE